MKRKIISETIDGSIKNVIQLKTLDTSLEYAQMFDALQNTPRDFQTKLIDALNSLSQTMGVAPEDAFNQVLCASNDENQDVKKKLYNWWRGFFEVLGKVSNGKVPRVRVSEYNQKIDDLMAEIMKSGDAEASNGEIVSEHSLSSAKKYVLKKGDPV